MQKIVDGTRDFTSGTGEDASTHSYCLGDFHFYEVQLGVLFFVNVKAIDGFLLSLSDISDVVPVFDNSSIPVTLECPYESSQVSFFFLAGIFC